MPRMQGVTGSNPGGIRQFPASLQLTSLNLIIIFSQPFDYIFKVFKRYIYGHAGAAALQVKYA